MLTPILAALTLLLADAAATPPPDPVTTEINALMEPYRGKPGGTLGSKLGLSTTIKPATNGKVAFWDFDVSEEVACKMDPASGSLLCGRGEPILCRLGVAYDAADMVMAWKTSGAPQACQAIIELLKAGE